MGSASALGRASSTTVAPAARSASAARRTARCTPQSGWQKEASPLPSPLPRPPLHAATRTPPHSTGLATSRAAASATAGRPASTLRARAQSAALRASGPYTTASQSGLPVGTVPCEGARPTTPQKAAGTRIEPAVSPPSSRGVRPAATAAAAPPEDPPGDTSSRHGLSVWP